ncbi:hypothetical protein FB446DRAFT_746799 [Lentinula raphanica]|nr:hypothetical protein FB446DRAFT_746799 [Lentinula raphanica]
MRFGIMHQVLVTVGLSLLIFSTGAMPVPGGVLSMLSDIPHGQKAPYLLYRSTHFPEEYRPFIEAGMKFGVQKLRLWGFPFHIIPSAKIPVQGEHGHPLLRTSFICTEEDEEPTYKKSVGSVTLTLGPPEDLSQTDFRLALNEPNTPVSGRTFVIGPTSDWVFWRNPANGEVTVVPKDAIQITYHGRLGV